MQLTHKAYEELLHGPLPEGVDVHNKDEDTLNDKSENLERLSNSAHMSHHMTKRMAALSKKERKEWGTRGSQAALKVLTPERRQAAGVRLTALNRTPESRKAKSDRMNAGQAKKMSRKAAKVNTLEVLQERGRKGSASRWADSEQHTRQSELMKRLNREGRLRGNHKIIGTTKLPAEPVYDFTVEDYHTALIHDGVLAHNCYGANAVHFSFLLEYMAFRIGLPIGVYRQFSNNFHAYLDVFPREKMERIVTDCYEELERAPTSTGPGLEVGFDDDLTAFMRWARSVIMNSHGMNIPAWKTEFFRSVAEPMFMAWRIRKNAQSGQIDVSLSGRTVEGELARIAAPDWGRACREWIERRA